MKMQSHNVKVIAINNGNKEGFNIFLDFSGQREFLMHHRHNGLLYNLLKDGMRTDALRRWEPVCHGRNKRVRGKRLESMVMHLLAVVDDYIEEREYA